MKYFLKLKALISIAFCLSVFLQFTKGQTFSFRNYGADNNIPNGFVYVLQQADDGYLWVGTGSGIARFDGYSFEIVPFPDSSTVRITNACLKDKTGTIWFGCNDGTVYFTKGHSLVQLKLQNEKNISDIITGDDGLIYIIPQSKAVFIINPETKALVKKYPVAEDQIMHSAAPAGKHRLLIGTQENVQICHFTADSMTVAGIIDGFNEATVSTLLRTGDSTKFIAGTEGDGLFKIHLSGISGAVTRFHNHQDLDALSVQSMIQDDENNIWISTFGNGVLELGPAGLDSDPGFIRNFNLNSGLGTDQIKTVFRDIEGNFWFATYGKGISMLTSYAFGYYSLGDNPARNNILYISAYHDKYLLGTPSGFHQFDPLSGKSVSFTDLRNIAGNTEITSYLLDKDGNLWIGTGGNGLFLRDNAGTTRRFYRSGDSGLDFIKDIESYGEDIWLATTNGVVVIDRKNGTEKHRFDISNGLPHNSINAIMKGIDGKMYIGTECDRLYSIDKDFNVIQGNAIMTGNTINKVLSFTQSSDGVIWVATLSNGLFRFRNDSVTIINRSDALLSNYCYGILTDSENNIWVGHDKGFSRYNPSKSSMRVFGADMIKAGACNPGAMYESADKKIFIGTTDGLIVYDRMKDHNNESAPFTNINYISINDVRYNYQPSFTIPYSKRNVIRVNYVGISFSNPGKVYYSTFLENFDNDWSKLGTSREVTYNLRDGEYKLRLISVNADGVSQEKEVSFNITIRHPFWRTWWFILLMFSSAGIIVAAIFKQREKAQKKIQEYLEKELAARTEVVLKQKSEIELQNIEITDSINYAKRIQSSILPDLTKLKEAFRDAFILFQPRDIVSGDFFWFDKIEDNRFILVCADSTGHGVPGAFMSMIGSTLLQDIVTRQRITKPSEILHLLDKQIFSTLNQNLELGVSNDGMDMVICEFDLKTRHLRFASAMRPVILFIGQESYYIKGNRSSIGGESLTEKFFDDQEYYLGENDSLYLFSDGLSDQFGGPEGKKMKIARLRKIIEEIVSLPMEKQKEKICDFYGEWKGSYEQVDDILIMGVRV